MQDIWLAVAVIAAVLAATFLYILVISNTNTNSLAHSILKLAIIVILVFPQQIGDVIESGPPQTRSNSSSSTNSTMADTANRTSSTAKRVSNGGNRSSRTSSSNGGGGTNGTHHDSDDSGGGSDAGDGAKTRHISASSTSSLTNGNVYSQPIQNKKGNKPGQKVSTKVDYDDDEVSFR